MCVVRGIMVILCVLSDLSQVVQLVAMWKLGGVHLAGMHNCLQACMLFAPYINRSTLFGESSFSFQRERTSNQSEDSSDLLVLLLVLPQI